MESLEIEPEKHGEYKTEDTDEKAVLLNYFRGNYFSEGRRSCSLKRVNYFSLALSLLLVASNVVLIGEDTYLLILLVYSYCISYGGSEYLKKGFGNSQ